MNIQQTASTPKLVTMIPADPQMTERDIRNKHLRIAPYCRVSTDKKEQLSSYEAQIEYYTEKINANPDWTLVRLYADEGITGTSAKKRKAFLQMIRDCERGKIDLVITKSVSRFCRNTLDGLNYVRRLKRHGVGVYFEKENVNTLFMDNEMILTFMMSQAQAESESLSGNVRWGHRKNFKDGKVYYHCKNFLGYRWGADGQPEIDPEQAAIVRRIFSRFLLGHSVRQITTDLMADGIKTATGKTVWHDIAAVLAGEEQTLSLPAVEHQIRNLQERQLELFQLIVSAGADCTDYDEELQQVYMAKTKLMAQKAELEKEHRGAAAFDSRLAELDMALEQASGALTDFDELTVRQLVSNIKVLDKDSLLICFKDGTEITQTIQRRRSA